MLKKNYLLIILVVILLIAGIAADVLFWKHIAAENQRQQNHWRSQTDALSAQLAQQQTELAALQNQLTQFMRSEQQNSSRQTLNEIAYLLDLANLYLQINRDPANAIKSLQLAQHLLNTLADPSLLSLQQALASDLNRLNDSTKIDIAEVLLKLQTLSESINRLTLTPQQMASPLTAANETPHPAYSHWYQNSLQTLWNSLKSLLVIRYHSSAQSPILPPGQREWVRENIAFTLAKAQWAVLQQKSALYQQCLTQVRQWLTDNYPGTPKREKILARLPELASIDIAPALPDINASLRAVQNALQENSNPPLKPRVQAPTPTPTPPPQPLPEKDSTPSAGIEI